MVAGGTVNSVAWKLFRLNAEYFAGPGKLRVPRHMEIAAFQTIRRLWGISMAHLPMGPSISLFSSFAASAGFFSYKIKIKVLLENVKL